MSKKEHGKYEEWLKQENLVRIQGWRRDGLTIDQIAHNMCVARNTLKTWARRYEPIATALKTGAECATYEVENAMYKAAVGYYVEDIEMTEVLDERGVVVQTTKKKHRRYIPPSTGAQVFILKNRRPDWWKDTRTIESKNDGQLAALIDGLKEPEKKEKRND